jgi:hypothetical protein
MGGYALARRVTILLLALVIGGCATSDVAEKPLRVTGPQCLEYNFTLLAGKMREALAECCPEVFVIHGRSRTFSAHFKTDIRKNVLEGRGMSITYHVREEGFILMVHVATHDGTMPIPKESLCALDNGESYWEAAYIIGEKENRILKATLRWGPKADRKAIEIVRQTVAHYAKTSE